jgi:hypothetical protein
MINTMKFNIAVGSDLGVCKNKEMTWDDLCEGFTTHKVSSSKVGQYFVGGYFSGNVRRDEFLVQRTLLALDIDDSDMTQAELEFDLILGLDCAFVAYSTYSHTKGAAKVRVVIPLSRGVTPVEYRELSQKFVAELGIKCDPCSFKPNQVMYTPRCKNLDDAWSMRMDGECLDVEPLLKSVVDVGFDLEVADLSADVEDAVKGMLAVVAAEPLDISDNEVSAYLDAYPSLGSEYHDWLNVGLALHHQYRGSEQGFELWYDWSNVGCDDEGFEREREDRHELWAKYKGFGNGQREKPRTFASVKHAVKERGGLDESVVAELRGVLVAGSEDFEELLVEASEIEDWGAYNIFKDKLLRMSTVKLGTDLRSAIASELFAGIGKAKGMSKAEIKKAITPAGVSNGGLVRDEGEVADWASVWIYIEATRLFYNIKRNYGISREAFNAKYDRMEECVASGMQASQLCLVIYKIDTVVDTIFWPGAGQIVMFEGKRMFNSYRKNGVRPCKVLDGGDGDSGDSEGREVVAMFLKHLEHLIGDEVEREIVLHWMIFVVQNPGKRLNWSLILQGTQGSGKSYIGNVMALLLGSNVQSLDTATISGRFTSWATGAILNIVEEIRISGTNRWAIMDRIKPYITNDQILCEKKGRDVQTLPNFTSYLLLTNHKDAVPLDDEDRRYCVVYSRLQTSEQLHEYFGGAEKVEEYFDRLFTMTRARPDAIARYFMDYKLPSSFKPFGRAPKTEAKSQMVDLAVSEVHQEVEDLLSRFADDLINKEFIDVTHLNSVATLNGEEIPKTRSLSSVLLDMGFRPIKGRYFRTYKPERKHYIWVKEGKTDDFAIEKVKEALKDGRLV